MKKKNNDFFVSWVNHTRLWQIGVGVGLWVWNVFVERIVMGVVVVVADIVVDSWILERMTDMVVDIVVGRDEQS